MAEHQPSTLAILDVGHGNSAVLRDTNGVVIIDAGPKSGLLEYLSEQKITKIEIVLISHAHADHIGGLINLLANIEIGQVYLNPNSVETSQIWDDLLYELNKLRLANKLVFQPALTASDSGKFNQGQINIEILAPTPYLAAKGTGSQDRQKRTLTTHSMSVVIRLTQNGIPIALFPGDLDAIGLENLIENHLDISSPILIFPHHGGKSEQNINNTITFTRKLCEMVQPQMIIFSIGRDGRKNPRPEVIKAIRQSLPIVKIACTQLSQHCATALPKTLPNHLAPVFSQGSETRKCCAGTLVINLDQPQQIFPSHETHQIFIFNNAPTALCHNVLP